MQVTFDTDNFDGGIVALTIGEIVERLVSDCVIEPAGGKTKSHELECGCDLSVTYSDEGGEVTETFTATDLCEYLDFDHCFWAKDENGGDVLVAIEN